MINNQFKHSEYTLTPTQVQNIINSAKTFRDKCLIQCLYYAGMRSKETTTLRAHHINFDQHHIIIEKSKGNKTRKIPIIDANFESDLRHYLGKRKEGLIFGIKPRTVQYIVERTAKRASVTHPNPLRTSINPHLFRHSISRHLKNARYSMEFIQNFLGHSSITTTMDTYGTLSFNDMQKEVARRTNNPNLLPRETHIPRIIQQDKKNE